MPLRWRWVLVLGITALGIFLCYPLQDKIKLGLDLKGGIHLSMRVQTDDAVKAASDLEGELLRAGLTEDGIKVGAIRTVDVNRIRVEGIEASQKDAFEDYLSSKFSSWLRDGQGVRGEGATYYELKMEPARVREIRESAVRQALETIRKRVDKFGVAEPLIQRVGFTGGGDDRILVQLPGIQNTERVKELIGSPAYLEWKLVSLPPGYKPDDFQRISPLGREQLLSMFGGEIPDDTEFLEAESGTPNGEPLYWSCKKASPITGNDLRDARRDVGRLGEPVVQFRLTSDAGRRFEDLTRANEGQLLAILLDKKVISAPRINATIRDTGIIEGSFTVETAEDLAIKLRSGALPAGMELLEERTVGPSLGSDSIRKGVVASILGGTLVVLFMLVYYRISGINASVALALNILLLLGAMGYLRATLTLPGIAGVALTIGMAVDANVLIFERIREESRLGRTAKSAVAGGFSKAFVTILDSNVTTLIAAVFLLGYGTGPIKGFAVTLCIGILANLFTAFFVSRTIFDAVLGGGRRVQTLSI